MIPRPRSALAAAIDAACGITPDQYAPGDPIAAFLAKHANDPDTFICSCGQERKIGERCDTPDRCDILYARATCVCSLPGATRRECGSKRNLKTPCRCYCHTRLPEEMSSKKTPAPPSTTRTS